MPFYFKYMKRIINSNIESIIHGISNLVVFVFFPNLMNINNNFTFSNKATLCQQDIYIFKFP